MLEIKRLAMEEELLSKIKYGNVELKNRMIFAPTTMGLSKKKYFKAIEEIAKGGVGLIIIGDVPVLKSPFMPSLYTKSGFKYYETLANIAHKYDAKICAQLHESDTNLKAMFKYMPKLMLGKIKASDLNKYMNLETSKYISSLSIDKVKNITSSFGKAALKAKAAGFDLVEVHGDRMCGSFTSSIFNKRNDIYGGSLENRFRFAKESIEAIKKADPNIAIDFKLVIRLEDPHYGNAGVTASEVKPFVKCLEAAGVNSYHVTLANHSKLDDAIPSFNHPYFKGEGCFLDIVKLVKDETKLPVCAVGGFNNPLFMNECIKAGRCDTIALARELICDPEFPNKVKSGNEEKIIHCARCNKGCLGGLMHHQGVHCILYRRK